MSTEKNGTHVKEKISGQISKNERSAPYLLIAVTSENKQVFEKRELHRNYEIRN